MNEMIERVARAIFDTNRPDICEQHRNEIWVNPRAENVREVARDLARAAIAAMRECTDGMEHAGEVARDVDECGVAWTYRAMITAALA